MKTFKKTITSAAALALLSAFIALPAKAQNRTYFSGTRNALPYAYGNPSGPTPLYIDNPTPVLAGTSVSFTVAFGQVVAGDGTSFNPLSTTAKINIGGPTNVETLTPTAVSCTTPTVYDSCTFTITTSNTHGKGEPITSATYGLAECIAIQNTAGGGICAVDAGWISAGGTKSIITAITAATPKVWVYDTSGVGPVWYGKSGTTTAAYSAVNNDQSFQLTLSAGTATKTLSQTYAVAPNCVGSFVSGTATGILKVAPTTTTVVATDSVSETPVVQVNCVLQK